MTNRNKDYVAPKSKVNPGSLDSVPLLKALTDIVESGTDLAPEHLAIRLAQHLQLGMFVGVDLLTFPCYVRYSASSVRIQVRARAV